MLPLFLHLFKILEYVNCCLIKHISPDINHLPPILPVVHMIPLFCQELQKLVCPQINAGETEENHENPQSGQRSLGQDLNHRPQWYEAGVLTTHP
jgi:hypothetical protein